MSIDDWVRFEFAPGEAPWKATAWSGGDWEAISSISDAEKPKRGLREALVKHSRQADGRYRPREVTLVVQNRDGDWDIGNPGSLWGSDIEQWTRLRCLVSDDSFSTDEHLFEGFIANLVPHGSNVDSQATITAWCLLGLLSKVEIDEQDRPREWTGDRVNAILTAAGVPSDLIGTISNGTVLMPAEAIAGNVAALLQECARAENGLLYTEPTGEITFGSRSQDLSLARMANRQFTITENGSGSELPMFTGSLVRANNMHAANRTVASRPVRPRPERGRLIEWLQWEENREYDDTPTGYPPTSVTRGPVQVDVAYASQLEAHAEGWQKEQSFGGGTEVKQCRLLAYPNSDSDIRDAVVAGDLDVMTRGRVLLSSTGRPMGWTGDLDFEARIMAVQHSIKPEDWRITLGFGPHANDRWSESAGYFEIGQQLSTSSKLMV